ncbi:unnamed protein product [Rhodiola kirilowii]
MDVDPYTTDNQPPQKHDKFEALEALTSGPLRSSLSKLSASSRAIPSDKDFHFYYNFDGFKLPVKEIVNRSESVLDKVGAAGDLLGKMMSFPRGDMDEGYDWLVGMNDEIFERFDSSVDDFERLRKRKEEGVVVVEGMEDDGFQLVRGRRKKVNQADGTEKSGGEDLSQSGVKMSFKDKKTLGAKPRVPFHIPTIRRPQDEYKILVNNANQPFEHVWLERSEDGSRFVHPLEKLSVLDFVDNNLEVLKPVEPPSVESTPFKLIQEVKDLKELSAKLCGVDEFAVDLEHNQYRSFQGLTCLMQISTRTEDFIVDTLKLRVHIGPYLREVFKDPAKKKVMHGADRDIVWLQRDFGIYICNLFDTGQASRVLKLERNSLEYLLRHFCGVSANKEYQNADWRLRPLPEEMIRYAREDTHYLLYIYDLLRIELTKLPMDPEKADDPLLEVYKRSYDICMQFYEKELLTENSYLYIYGLLGSKFNAQQLAIVAGLFEWRDIVARAEDESTGYILPNKTLLEIAKEIPITVGKLRRLVKSKHPYVERNIGAVLNIIFHAIQNASAFETVAEQLKQGALNAVQEQVPVDIDEDASASASMEVEDPSTSSIPITITTNGDFMPTIKDTNIDFASNKQGGLHEHVGNQRSITSGSYGYASAFPSENTGIPMSLGTEIVEPSGQSTKVSATVQVAKKPSRAFGALFGTGLTKKSGQNANDKEATKLEHIKSSVNLPFHSFTGTGPLLKPSARKEQITSFAIRLDENPAEPPVGTNGALEEIIVLEDEKGTDEPANVIEGNTSTDAEPESKREDNGAGTSNNSNKDDDDDEDKAMPLSELSSSFRKCFQPRQTHKPLEPSASALLNFKPFDYEEARQQIQFGNRRTSATGEDDNGGPGRKDKKKKSSVTSQERRVEESGGFQPGRRSQAFPVTGNRSATFKSP